MSFGGKRRKATGRLSVVRRPRSRSGRWRLRAPTRSTYASAEMRLDGAALEGVSAITFNAHAARRAIDGMMLGLSNVRAWPALPRVVGICHPDDVPAYRAWLDANGGAAVPVRGDAYVVRGAWYAIDEPLAPLPRVPPRCRASVVIPLDDDSVRTMLCNLPDGHADAWHVDPLHDGVRWRHDERGIVVQLPGRIESVTCILRVLPDSRQ